MPVAALISRVVAVITKFHNFFDCKTTRVSQLLSEISDNIVMTQIPAAERTLRLLTTMAKIGQPTSASLLAQRLGIPRSSVYQLLAELEKQDFAIHFSKERKWGLGVKSFEIGSAYSRHQPLERLARPVVEKLIAELNQITLVSGHLAVLDGDQVLYLLEQKGKPSLGLITDVGIKLPAHLTASGRAMLQGLSDKQLRANYGGFDYLQRRTELGPGTFRQLQEQLKTERELGYSLEVDEVTVGFASIGVGLRNHLGQVIAGLSITFRSSALDKMPIEQIVKKMEAESQSLSRKFGHHDN